MTTITVTCRHCGQQSTITGEVVLHTYDLPDVTIDSVTCGCTDDCNAYLYIEGDDNTDIVDALIDAAGEPEPGYGIDDVLPRSVNPLYC